MLFLCEAFQKIRYKSFTAGVERGVIWQMVLLPIKSVLCFSSLKMSRCLVVNSQNSLIQSDRFVDECNVRVDD
jgi:hypothetical protein